MDAFPKPKKISMQRKNLINELSDRYGIRRELIEDTLSAHRKFLKTEHSRTRFAEIINDFTKNTGGLKEEALSVLNRLVTHTKTLGEVEKLTKIIREDYEISKLRHYDLLLTTIKPYAAENYRDLVRYVIDNVDNTLIGFMMLNFYPVSSKKK